MNAKNGPGRGRKDKRKNGKTTNKSAAGGASKVCHPPPGSTHCAISKK